MLRLLITLLASSMFLAACADDKTYPLSGDVCTAEDAVLDLDTNDCIVPGI